VTTAGLRWEAPAGHAGIDPGETHVLAFDADHPALDRHALELLLSPDERARAGRLARPADRGRFVAGRALLRETLARYTGGSPARIRFSYAASGKPALAPGDDGLDLRFNASGSHGLVLVALRRGSDVGVDVERIHPVREGSAESAMTPGEFARYQSLAEVEREHFFFQTWAAKEAVSKSLGEGLRLGFADFTIPPGGGRVSWRDGCEASGTPAAWALPLPPPHAGFAAAVAFTAAPGAIRLRNAFESRTAT
jgi:4'-phosphopantetheinyl transferase